MHFELQQPLWFNSMPATAVLLYYWGVRHKPIAEQLKQIKGAILAQTLWYKNKQISLNRYVIDLGFVPPLVLDNLDIVVNNKAM